VSKYTIQKISAFEAEKVWNNSPQASIFTNPTVLDELASEVHWWGVYKGEEMNCIWPVALDGMSKPIVVPFSYWQGPLWSKKAFDHPAHRTLSLKTAVYELFIETFIRNYGTIKASLHPSILDIRVFDWWNYHNSEKPKFTIKPKYTAAIKGLQISQLSIEKNFRINRRRELTKFSKIDELVFFDSACSKAELVSLYCETLQLNRSEIENSLASLLKIIENGFGWIQSIRKRSDSSLCGLILILNDKNQANLVINLATIEFKDMGLMASNINRAIQLSQSKGIEFFDFNGANSPYRGDDKHSYGAEPILYFDLEYNDRT
jgi:hypothetical protein